MRWKIAGYDSGNPTGFLREETCGEATIKALLERLAARRLTADEITDATLGAATFFSINREKRYEMPVQMMTVGNPYYVAIEVRNARRT